jgi:hypothetical protein
MNAVPLKSALKKPKAENGGKNARNNNQNDAKTNGHQNSR